jgi:PST family polysaccharide transporter
MSTLSARLVSGLRSRWSDARVRQSASNLIWTGSEQLLRLFTGLVVGLWVARYLQPVNYGLLQFAMSWVALFNAIAWLGVGEAVLRDFVQRPHDHPRILGTALLLRLTGSVIAGGLAFGIATLSHGREPMLLTLVAVFCLAIPFAEMPAGVFLWFQSQGRLRGPMLAVNGIRIGAALLKVGLIVSGIGVVGFALVGLAESVAICASIFAIYLAVKVRPRGWRTDFTSAKAMLVSGAPLILSALATSLNSRIDQLMIGWLSDFSQVGIYAAATKFSELWWIVPTIVMNSLSPSYVYADQPVERVRKNVAWIGFLLLLAAIFVGGLVTLAAPPVVALTLGPKYLGAVPILLVHVWLAIFIFADAPMTQYLVATHRQRYITLKVCLTLALNLALNALWVPRHGALGAAVATLAATGAVSVSYFFLFRATRDVGQLQIDMLRLLTHGAWRIALTKIWRHKP